MALGRAWISNRSAPKAKSLKSKASPGGAVYSAHFVGPQEFVSTRRHPVKRALIVVLIAFGTVVYAQRGAAPGQAGQAPAGQAGPGGRGRGLSPEQQAALAKQDELEKNTAQIPFDAVSLPLQPGPENTIGETVGVAVNSQKHLFVYTRTGNLGPARGAQAAKLFEFDQTGKFVKEWGAQAYGFSFAHTVRVDKEDNVWVTDEGSK